MLYCRSVIIALQLGLNDEELDQMVMDCDQNGLVFFIKNDEFCMKNDEFCVKNDGFRVKNDEFCVNNDGFRVKNDEFCILGTARSTIGSSCR